MMKKFWMPAMLAGLLLVCGLMIPALAQSVPVQTATADPMAAYLDSLGVLTPAEKTKYLAVMATVEKYDQQANALYTMEGTVIPGKEKQLEELNAAIVRELEGVKDIEAKIQQAEMQAMDQEFAQDDTFDLPDEQAEDTQPVSNKELFDGMEGLSNAEKAQLIAAYDRIDALYAQMTPLFDQNGEIIKGKESEVEALEAKIAQEEKNVEPILARYTQEQGVIDAEDDYADAGACGLMAAEGAYGSGYGNGFWGREVPCPNCGAQIHADQDGVYALNDGYAQDDMMGQEDKAAQLAQLQESIDSLITALDAMSTSLAGK